MTVNVTSAFTPAYTANGATTVFPFGFAAMAADEVSVLVNGAATSGFTVTLNADQSDNPGGSVTFATAPANGATVLIISAPDFEQDVSFENAGAFLPSSHDIVNDRAAVRDIYLKAGIARSLRGPDGETIAPLPSATNREGKFLGFGPDGAPAMLSGTGNDTALRTDLALSSGSALVGYGSRTLAQKLGDVPAITDYANQAAVQAASASSFFLPQGQSLTVSGAMTKSFYGPGKVQLAGSGNVPGAQGGAVGGYRFIQTVTPGTGQHFGVVSKLFTGTRTDTGSAPGQNHGAAAYFEAQRGAGSSDGVWGLNTITEIYNLNGATIGYEIDVNNFSGVDPGLSPAQDFIGLSIVSGASGRGGTAFTIARNGDYASNHWNRGLHLKDTLLRAFEFTNNGTATGFWSDTMMSFTLTASAEAVAKLIPFDSDDVLMRGTNAAANLILFDVDQNTTANETNVKMSVAGAAAKRVSVGAADSGGTGYRVLRVAN